MFFAFFIVRNFKFIKFVSTRTHSNDDEQSEEEKTTNQALTRMTYRIKNKKTHNRSVDSYSCRVFFSFFISGSIFKSNGSNQKFKLTSNGSPSLCPSSRLFPT